jgi:hypothetical protein
LPQLPQFLLELTDFLLKPIVRRSRGLELIGCLSD